MTLFRISFYSVIFLSFSSAAEIFEADCGQFEYESIAPYNLPSTSVLPAEVIEAALTTAKASSIASAVTLSPTLMLQGARIATVSALISCREDSEFSANDLSWLDSPTQMVLGDDDTRFLKGAVVGNWLVLGAFCGVHALAAYRFGKPAVHFPGLGVLPFAFFLAPTTQSSVNLLRFGNSVDKSLGALSLLGEAGVFSALIWIFLPSHFKAQYQTEPNFVERYGTLFQSYDLRYFYFILPEISLNVLSGVLAAVQVAPPISCIALGSILTTTYGVFSLITVVLHPQIDKIDYAFNSISATAQFAALLLGTIRKSNEQMEGGKILQAIAEGISVSISYLTLAWTGIDLIRLIYNKWTPVVIQRLPKKSVEQTLKILLEWICLLQARPTPRLLPQAAGFTRTQVPLAPEVLIKLDKILRLICSNPDT